MVGAGADVLRSEKGCVWMLNFWQIEVDRYPAYGEKLRIVTNPYSFDKLFAKRNFMLYDENGIRIAAANSFWFMFDIATLHPRRLTEDITSVYELGEKQPLREYSSRWVLGMELLPEDFKIQEVRVEYRTGVFAGETIYPRILDQEGPARRIAFADEKGGVCAVLSFIGE